MGTYTLRLRSFSFRAEHKHTAASNSTSPAISRQHLLATGLPSPTCTSLPRTSTHAPSFSASIGHIVELRLEGGEGHGFPGFPLVGGLVVLGGRIGRTIPGGRTGGSRPGGRVMGGRSTGGLTIGGRVTGGRVTGGLTTGGLILGTLGGFGVGL